jgi:hypothetical protein
VKLLDVRYSASFLPNTMYSFSQQSFPQKLHSLGLPPDILPLGPPMGLFYDIFRTINASTGFGVRVSLYGFLP